MNEMTTNGVRMAADAISVEGLNVDYLTAPLTRAVSDVAFGVGAGTALSIVGESGSGKSSVVRAFGGLLHGKAEVSWDALTVMGRRIASGSLTGPGTLGEGRLLGYVFQEPKSYLNPSLKIGRQLVEVIRQHVGLDASNARAEAIQLLHDVGVPDPEARLGTYAHQLSGGLAQRVAIAMAIAPRPAVLIADEPTSSLDVTVAARVIGLIRRLQIERGMALIHVTHSLHLAAKTSDRVLVMYAGEVVESGVAHDVLNSPQMPYTKALLAAAPTADGRGGMTPIAGSAPDLRYMWDGCRFRNRCPHAQAVCDQDTPLRSTSGTRQVRCHRSTDLNNPLRQGACDV